MNNGIRTDRAVNSRRTRGAWIVVTAIALGSSACAAKRAATPDETLTTEAARPQVEQPIARSLETPDRHQVAMDPADAARRSEAPLEFPVVRFEFDSEVLTADGREALDSFAQGWRSRGRGGALLIEGHADERGTEEYNLVLGQKRASAVRRYLTTLGLPGEAVRTVSYGENRPLDGRSTEEAWARNRRAEVRENASR